MTILIITGLIFTFIFSILFNTIKTLKEIKEYEIDKKKKEELFEESKNIFKEMKHN